MAHLFILLFLFTFPGLTFSNTFPPGRNVRIISFEKIPLPPRVRSTGAITFDSDNEGPYIGVFDGRILKYNKNRKTFENFAYTSPKRTAKFCDGTVDFNKLQRCGFPAEMRTDPRTGKIYVVDSTLGLKELKRSGGLAKTLVPSRDGVPYHGLTAVDAATNGKVYYVDLSSVYGLRDVNTSVATGDSTGKLFSYDTSTKAVAELLSQLAGGGGLATNRDASSAFISEYSARRIRKYYIKGPKAGTSETLLSLPGNPSLIRRIKGEDNFWVSINNVVNQTFARTSALKFSSDGRILEILDLTRQFSQLLATVLQKRNELYVVGLNIDYLGKYTLASS